jgi:hypothetical protein
MATITVGTGATINATTIEGQLFQLIHFINNTEAIAGGNNNKFSLSKDDDAILTSSFTLEGQFIYTSASGTFAESPIPYLPTTVFNPGSPLGTIKGATLAQYFIDAMSYALVWQNNINKNPQKLTGIQLTFDYQTLTYAGSLSLPYSTVLSNSGGVVEVATEWLLT